MVGDRLAGDCLSAVNTLQEQHLVEGNDLSWVKHQRFMCRQGKLALVKQLSPPGCPRCNVWLVASGCEMVHHRVAEVVS